MESSSDPASSAERTNHRLADIVGTAIALLTLALPLVAIAYYSSSNTPSLPPSSYSAPRTKW